MSVSCWALAMASVSPVPAEDIPARPEEQTVIVVGQQDAPISIAPRGLSVSLGDEQFAGVNAQNVEDLMKYAPDFFVRKRYAGDSNGVPGFRGTHSVQSARALVMVDGFTVSNFLGNSFGFAPKWGVVGPGEVARFDIVYGPYSARYSGHSMGGIVNITMRSPTRTEAFASVQAMVQPYRQYGTDAAHRGWSGEAGFGWRQKDGPWSARLSARHFRGDGQPMSWYGLVPASGAGVAVTGAVVDAGQAIPNTPGTAANPIFAAQSPARTTQDQAKLRIGYDGGVTAETLFAWWRNVDLQDAPDCYLRDAAGTRVCEGRVTTLGRSWSAVGARWSRTVRDEVLAGVKLAAPVAEDFAAKVNVSTYRIARSDGFASANWAAGASGGAGTLARQGPTGWYTAELSVEAKGPIALAAGASANLYETDLTNFTLPGWRRDDRAAFSTRTFGKTRLLAGWAEGRLGADALVVTLGARVEDWRAFDGGLGRVGSAGTPVFARYAARHGSAFDPKLSVEWHGGATSVQLSLAEATRFPTVGELFQGSLNGDGSFNADSFDPNLRPERSRDANLLVAHDLGRVKLTGSLFWQRVEDTIFSFTGFNQNGVTSSSYKNIDLTRQYGIEAIVEAREVVPGLDVDANVAWIDSRTVRNASAPAAEGVMFPRIPRWRVNTNLRYSVTPRVLASLGVRYATRPNTDLVGSQRGDTFGYTSELFALDARVNWKPAANFRLSAGVDNITNDRAWVYHPYPQRSLLVEAGWTL
jgi:iron complex outermembrane receptor protein